MKEHSPIGVTPNVESIRTKQGSIHRFVDGSDIVHFEPGIAQQGLDRIRNNATGIIVVSVNPETGLVSLSDGQLVEDAQTGKKVIERQGPIVATDSLNVVDHR